MTTTFDDLSAWRDERRAQIGAGVTLGFVPTMGALHEGHLSLVRRSRAENDRTLVSIFVNPAQFDDPSDLGRYPRTLESDLSALQAEQTEFVLLPSAESLYPDEYRFRVRELDLSTRLEGSARPGHFEGVLTVVLKLLQIASADRAYFGEKDWQQLMLGTADVSCLLSTHHHRRLPDRPRIGRIGIQLTKQPALASGPTPCTAAVQGAVVCAQCAGGR